MLDVTLRWVLAGLVGFTVGYSMQAHKITELRSDALKKDNAALTTANAESERLRGELATMGKKIASDEERHQKELQNARQETQDLRDCVANGKCGLRVNATCPRSSASVPPGTTSPASVDNATGAALTPDAEQAYYALRDGIGRLEVKLAACQDYAKAVQSN